MKNITRLVCALVAVMSLGAIAVSQASAATPGYLCKTAPVSHECGESRYASGTEVNADNGTTWNPVYLTDSHNQLWLGCERSSLKMKVAYPATGWASRLAISSWSFSSCESGNTMQLVPPTWNPEPYFDLMWREGTNNGTLQGHGTLLKVKYATLGGVECTYEVSQVAPANAEVLVGGASPKLNFLTTVPLTLQSQNQEWCKVGGNMTFHANYNITTPTPLYVEKQ
ncbi:MAG TPA: hypothetical protein VFX35_02995 [Solirubrobacterales bacterium]|nr:hypothetical protein [Solirubrobacterales bacterium]